MTIFPISTEDSEYLKVVNVTRTPITNDKLIESLTETYRMKETMVKESPRAFLNQITPIEGFPHRAVDLSENTDWVRKVKAMRGTPKDS